jgi:hypothetical protein
VEEVPENKMHLAVKVYLCLVATFTAVSNRFFDDSVDLDID